ncbi:hypothetical protein M899_0747 [Bacteriovorax sp. BSW11_IV]|nr:hypothetical protein M899_0747 [Bacteriovorax sp. BSW11_IV]
MELVSKIHKSIFTLKLLKGLVEDASCTGTPFLNGQNLL